MTLKNDENEQPVVALLISSQLQQDILSPQSVQRLNSLARVVSFIDGKPSAAQVPQLIQQAVICMTGWDTPPLDAALFEHAPQLRLIAHTAGSIHRLVLASVFQHGIRVSHANAALAEGVAEFTILQALMCLRRIGEFDHLLKEGHAWEREPGKLLRTQTFGIVSVGSIGKEVIARLKPFGCRIIAYDPYLTADAMLALGVEVTDLETLFATADIVSLHTPLLPTTRGMIGARHLSLLHDGAILLNTARAGIVEEDALLRELTTGRIMAALDVFHQEPLPLDSPLRSLSNVILSPHIAALTSDTLLRQGQLMVDEIQRFLRGAPLHYEIQPAQLSIMA
jgi:Phosphoglycerate dehydrogenase and related dehydrogenases